MRIFHITLGCILLLASLASSSPELGKILTQSGTSSNNNLPLHPLETFFGTKTNVLTSFASLGSSEILTCPLNTLTAASTAVWQSLGYPSRTQGPTQCCLTIVPRADTCFIRIRFEDAHLTAPRIDSCEGNTLSIFGQAQGIANNVFCGALNNYETFVRPVPNSIQYGFKGRPPVRLNLNIRDSIYDFKIHIKQIPCSQLGGVRPPGFTTTDAFGNGRSITKLPKPDFQGSQKVTNHLQSKEKLSKTTELATEKRSRLAESRNKNPINKKKLHNSSPKSIKLPIHNKNSTKTPLKRRKQRFGGRKTKKDKHMNLASESEIESALRVIDGALNKLYHQNAIPDKTNIEISTILSKYNNTLTGLETGRKFNTSMSRKSRQLDKNDLADIAALNKLCRDFTSRASNRRQNADDEPEPIDFMDDEFVSTRITDAGQSLEVDGDAPYAGYVLTRSEGGYNKFCGATLIDPNYALTSCSCVMRAGYDTGMYEIKVVFTGDGDIDDDDSDWSDLYNEDEGSHAVDRVAIHPLCLHNGYQYDIAVLHLATPETDVEPIQLARCDQSYDGLEVTEMGHGFEFQNRRYDIDDFEDLHFEDGDTISNAACNSAYSSQLNSLSILSNPVIGDELFCIELDDNDQICEGDQGGPVVTNYAETSAVLVGIIAGNANNCVRDERGPLFSEGQFPDVAVRISCVLDFIDAATTDPDRFESIVTLQNSLPLSKPLFNIFG